MRYSLLLLLWCCGAAFVPLAAQWSWLPETSVGYAWGGIRALGGQPLRATGLVGRVGSVVRYRRGAWAIQGGAGAKWLLPRGRFGETPYRGRALRLVLPVGLDYRWRGGRWLGLGYEWQTARHLADFRASPARAVRHNLWGRYRFTFRHRWLGGLLLHGALDSLPATFYVADPRWSVSLSFTYQINAPDE